MCEFCPGTGVARCPVCACDVPLTPENAGKRFTPDPVALAAARAGDLADQISYVRWQIETLTRQLNELLEARGSRPTDGSDQPALFETDATPSMF